MSRRRIWVKLEGILMSACSQLILR